MKLSLVIVLVPFSFQFFLLTNLLVNISMCSQYKWHRWKIVIRFKNSSFQMRFQYSHSIADQYGTFQVSFSSKAFLVMVEKWFKEIKIGSLVSFSSIQMKSVKLFVDNLFSIDESKVGKSLVLFSSEIFLKGNPMMNKNYLKKFLR